MTKPNIDPALLERANQCIYKTRRNRVLAAFIFFDQDYGKTLKYMSENPEVFLVAPNKQFDSEKVTKTLKLIEYVNKLRAEKGKEEKFIDLQKEGDFYVFCQPTGQAMRTPCIPAWWALSLLMGHQPTDATIPYYHVRQEFSFDKTFILPASFEPAPDGTPVFIGEEEDKLRAKRAKTMVTCKKAAKNGKKDNNTPAASL